MSETKVENCSLSSPCDDKICNLNTNKCTQEKDQLTVYIKKKLFTGTQKNVIDRIKEEYSKVTKNAKCDMGAHSVNRQEYKGQNITQLQQTLKEGKIIAFYNPDNDSILCVTRYELVEYWNKVLNDYYGIIISKEQGNTLAKIGSNFFQHLVTNAKRDFFVPLNDQSPSVFIKKSRINQILTSGHTFFAIIRTDKIWLSVPTQEAKYNNYNPSENKYGNKLFIIVPLTEEKNGKTKEELKGVKKFKQLVEKKYCKITKTLLPDRKIQQLSKKLYLYLLALKQDKLSENEKIVVDKLTVDLAKVKPSQKVNYPYWYDLNNPMGLKLVKTLKKHNIKLRPNAILTPSNISFEYQEKYIPNKKNYHSRFIVRPVYINTRINQYLVCQKYDVNYEVNLYVVNWSNSQGNRLYFTQHLDKAIKYYDTLDKKSNRKINKMPLNMGFPRTIPIEPVYKANQDPDYTVDIYGVVVIFKNGSYNLYICGTSLKAMTREYESLFGGSESKEAGKLLVKLKMDVKLRKNIFNREVLKEEYYESPMSNRLKYLKNFAEAYRKQHLASMTEEQIDKYNRYINRVLEKQRQKDLTPETKEEMKQNIRNIVGHFYNTVLKE